MPDDVRPERIQIGQALRIVGISRRALQEMSARGDVPGAAKIGARWTFDLITLRRWVKAREAAACQKISTDEGKPGGRAFNVAGMNTAAAYAQLIGKKPAGASPTSRAR